MTDRQTSTIIALLAVLVGALGRRVTPRIDRVLQFERPRRIVVQFEDHSEITAIDNAGVRQDIEDDGLLDMTCPMPPPAHIHFSLRRRRTRSYRSWEGALRALDKLAPGWRDAIEDERP